jgi:acetoin utilization deacetylase AcuC-like enzyme
VHHGNGTQDVFWTDGGVFYFSLHQSPWYPGTGRAHETGAGAGLGRTRNVPLPAGTTADAWLAAFRASLGEIGREFAPEFILVSAGFDCLAGDPLGQFLLEPADLHAATLDVLALARETAQGRVALVLEGGYAPKRVGAGVVDTFRALCGLAPKEPPAAD